MRDMTKLVKLMTVADVVKAYDGPSGMAGWAGIGAPAVCNWIERGFIPPGWHWRLDRDARERGYEIDQGVFDERMRRKSKRSQRSGSSAHSERVA